MEKGIFKAKRLNSEDYVIGFFTKKKIGGLFLPVIERIVECDSGDYIESIEIDGNTLTYPNYLMHETDSL